MAKKKTTYSWDVYVKEAEKPPFELEISPDDTLIIECPDAIALGRLADAMRGGDLEVALYALVGEHWPRVKKLLSNVGYEALDALLQDLLEHFDLAQEITLVGPGGGEIKTKKMREVSQLVTIGYRPVGEVSSSRN